MSSKNRGDLVDFLTELFDNGMFALKGIFIILGFIFFILLMYKICKLIILIFIEIINYIRLNKGIIIFSDFNNCSIKDYRNWCINFLYKNSYKNIVKKDLGDKYCFLTCQNNDMPNCVLCYKETISMTDRDLDENAVRLLLSFMKINNINDGIIISNGKASKSTLEFINSMPDNLCITILDCNALKSDFNINNTGYKYFAEL